MRHPDLGRGVLVTRPEPGLSETMAAVAELGFMPVACPLLRITHPVMKLPRASALAGILLTSGQAVAPLAAAARHDPGLLALPVFAVGDGTAARARDAGFADTRSAAGDASDLADLVRGALPGTRRNASGALLLATAVGQGHALAGMLRGRGARVQRRAVYEAVPARGLPDAALAALRSGRLAACLFFSGETARNFARLCPVSLHPALYAAQALAISPSVGAALAALPWRLVRIAQHPDAAAMLALLRQDVQAVPSCRSTI